MAVVQKKKEDGKYKHLTQLYTNFGEEKAIKIDDTKKSKEEIKIKESGLKIERKDLVKDAVIVLGLAVVCVSGYLISRFL